LIQSRVQWLWNERANRQERQYRAAHIGDHNEYDNNGNVIGTYADMSFEVQVAWTAWQIKQDFQKTTLRDVFMEAVADEFNRYGGIRAQFITHALDDQRIVSITTTPTIVEQPTMLSWPNS
jgi:hypothetical protein